MNIFTVSNTFKIIRKEKVKGFLSFDQVFNLKISPIFPSKLQINLESDGILFELQQFDQKIALMFLDPQDKIISFIEPSTLTCICIYTIISYLLSCYILVYIPYMKKFLSLNISKSSANILDQQQPVNKWLENSFSLSDWTTEESSIDEDSLKKDNKLVRLKRII